MTLQTCLTPCSRTMTDKSIYWHSLNELISGLCGKIKGYSRNITVECGALALPYSSSLPEVGMKAIFGITFSELVERIISGEIMNATLHNFNKSSYSPGYNYYRIPIILEASGPERNFFRVVIVCQGYARLELSGCKDQSTVNISLTR